MRDPKDLKAAASIRDISAGTAMKFISIDRREISETSGECASQALVQSKARDLSQLIDEAMAQLAAFQAKGG